MTTKEEILLKLEQQKAEVERELSTEFQKEYESLCERYGYHIVAQPTFISNGNGSFAVSVNYFILKMEG